MDGAQTCNMSSIGLHLYPVTLKATVRRAQLWSFSLKQDPTAVLMGICNSSHVIYFKCIIVQVIYIYMI